MLVCDSKWFIFIPSTPVKYKLVEFWTYFLENSFFLILFFTLVLRFNVMLFMYNITCKRSFRMEFHYKSWWFNKLIIIPPEWVPKKKVLLKVIHSSWLVNLGFSIYYLINIENLFTGRIVLTEYHYLFFYNVFYSFFQFKCDSFLQNPILILD